jgi:putative nucleotidyltransferase with HDIG domain
MRATHLVARFFESVRAEPVGAVDVDWVAAALQPAELHAWQGMSRADRAESVAVARRLEVALANTPAATDTRWRGAALLHDVGKQASGYGTVGRVTVTVIATVVGKSRTREWVSASSPMRARVGRYVGHDDVGAALLREVGARPEIAAWAEAHHRREWWGGTGIPNAICRALALADGEPAPAD